MSSVPGARRCRTRQRQGPSRGMTIARRAGMDVSVLAGSAATSLATRVAHGLGIAPCQRSLRRFDDEELHVEVDESIRGRDVYVIQSTSTPVDEHVIELLFLADACRRGGAARLTAVVPYFGYARQDRRAKGCEAVGAAVIASLIEAAGFARVVAIDLHAPAIEGFFRIPVEHLSATALLAAVVTTTSDSVLVAPDLGAVKLAERYQALLNIPVVVIHKARVSGAEVSLRGLFGEVRDRAPIVVDDMITTGGTVEAAVKGLLDAGCRPDISVVSTHALFVGRASARMAALPIRQLIGTNTVEGVTGLPPHFRVVDVAPLLVDAIGRLHRDEPLAALLSHT